MAVLEKYSKYNDEGRLVISRDDEWLNETEWDELFCLLANSEHKGKQNVEFS